ncbi:MAG: FtsX-like permease family protein [Flavobacteriales bacterium]
MAFAHFIARRILFDKDRQDRLSRPIVLIAVLGIVIGMAVMILTIGISTGFQGEVRAKVTGAGGHLQIVPLAQGDPKASERVRIQQSFYPWLDTVPGVAHIQVFALQPGIVQTGEEIQGVVVKGVGADQDWSFLKNNLVSGNVLDIGATVKPQTLISRWMARRLRLDIGDTITIYLVKGREEVRPRKFRVQGIYETGLEKVDHQLALVDIAHLQRFAQWGIQAELQLEEAVRDSVHITALAFGGDRSYHYSWPDETWTGKGPHALALPPGGDAKITLIAGDDGGTLPDTAWIRLQRPVSIAAGATAPLQVTRGGHGGTYKDYCGGFEVSLKDYAQLTKLDDRIYRDFIGPGLRTITARQQYPEVFSWLELLDTNVIVVIVLMVLVAIINMASALLIIILERTNMIGVLKALGTSNGAMRRIFLIDAAYILGVGILLGDLLGIGLALVQKQWGLARLPIESYYVDKVPIDLSFGPIVALNIGVLLVCVLAMVLPSMYVSRIAPAKAIRFT